MSTCRKNGTVHCKEHAHKHIVPVLMAGGCMPALLKRGHYVLDSDVAKTLCETPPGGEGVGLGNACIAARPSWSLERVSRSSSRSCGLCTVPGTRNTKMLAEKENSSILEFLVSTFCVHIVFSVRVATPEIIVFLETPALPFLNPARLF